MPYDSAIDRTDAAALIPEDVATEIFQGMPAKSVALTKFRQVTMSRKQKRLPVLSFLPTAYFVNGETGLKQTTEQKWANKYLDAEELAVLVPIPEELAEDADYDIFGEVKPRLIEAFGAALDLAVLFGTNKPSSWPTAIVPAAAAAGNALVRGSVASQDIAGDISQVMGLVEADGFDPNGHAAPKSLKHSLRNLRDENGALVFQQALTAGTPSTIWAEDVMFCAKGAWKTTDADLITGDWNEGLIGIRKDISYKVFTEGVITNDAGQITHNLMQQDMACLRAVMRVAFQVPNPINLDNADDATRYPFAVLRPVGYSG